MLYENEDVYNAFKILYSTSRKTKMLLDETFRRLCTILTTATSIETFTSVPEEFKGLW